MAEFTDNHLILRALESYLDTLKLTLSLLGNFHEPYGEVVDTGSFSDMPLMQQRSVLTKEIEQTKEAIIKRKGSCGSSYQNLDSLFQKELIELPKLDDDNEMEKILLNSKPR